jgi:hypothetical protein
VDWSSAYGRRPGEEDRLAGEQFAQVAEARCGAEQLSEPAQGRDGVGRYLVDVDVGGLG